LSSSWHIGVLFKITFRELPTNRFVFEKNQNEMRCKVDSTENPRSFEKLKYPTPPQAPRCLKSTHPFKYNHDVDGDPPVKSPLTHTHMYIQHNNTNAPPLSQPLGNYPHTSDPARQSYQTLHFAHVKWGPNSGSVAGRFTNYAWRFTGMYICVHECIYTYTYVKMYIYLYTYTYIYMYIYLCTYTNYVWRFTGKWAVKLLFCR